MKPTPEEAFAAFEWWEKHPLLAVTKGAVCHLLRSPRSKCPVGYRRPRDKYHESRTGCATCQDHCWIVSERYAPYRLRGHGDTRLEALLDAMRKEAAR